MTCKQAHIQTEPFPFTVQLTGNYVFWTLRSPAVTRWANNTCLFKQAAHTAPKTESKKLPSAHYGTNNPSHVWGMEEPTGRLPSQPVDLWQRPEVRLRGEFLPSLRGGNFADVATSHCQEKIPLKKERNNRDQTEEIKSLSYLHILAEDQPLVRCVLLHKGQQEVGGLLPSPLITLNDSNGHTFEIKSTYSHAHMHMHTGHSHTDLALHSLQPWLQHWPSSRSGWLLWVRGKHLDYYFYFSFLYSQRTVERSHVSYTWRFQSRPSQVKKHRHEIRHALIDFSLHILWCYDDAIATSKSSIDMETEFYANLLEIIFTSIRWRANRKLFGRERVSHKWG